MEKVDTFSTIRKNWPRENIVGHWGPNALYLFHDRENV